MRAMSDTLPIVEAHVPGSGRKALALTFDDGPSNATEAILDVLDEHGARATFFVLGTSLDRGQAYEALARRAVATGHELGNHTYDHPHLGEHDDDTVLGQLERAAARIESVAGSRPRVIRCPYGEDQERVARLGARTGAGALISWSVDPEDWADPAPEAIVASVLARAEPGTIVVMHDFEGRAGTATALKTIVPRLVESGYELVTVSELLAL
jgi:peptidoglycan/xylan/chitin deacetylase (PgdA/CDA1 family)